MHVNTAAADVKYDANARLKTFDYVISSQPVVMKMALAKWLEDSGIGYQRLNNLFEAHGEKGLDLRFLQIHR